MIGVAFCDELPRVYSRLVDCQLWPRCVRPGTNVVPAGRRLAAMVSTFRDWFVMLATTRMTKSFKMVLLRVLLDND
ncbi:MAG: hypothetical protein EBT73_07030, partial [Actinobacteria bacterium]|nr:hypothetical protein [Actinomycetota bacterium]